jgi:hypothetical protein
MSNLQASDFIMADYKAPLRDMHFVLNEVFEVAKLDELTAWLLDRAKSNPNEIDGQSGFRQRGAGRFLREQTGYCAVLFRSPAAADSLVERVGEGR